MAAAFAVSMAAAPCQAQSWPATDCPTLLSAGQPRPVWGSAEKPDQTTLLTLINYQLAISLCQQEDISKSLREQRASSKEALAKPVPKPSAPAAPPSKDPLAEVLRDAIEKQALGLSDAAKASPPGSDGKSTVGNVTATLKRSPGLDLK